MLYEILFYTHYEQEFCISFFLSFFLLISCSTSVDDGLSSGSNRGLTIAIKTGNSQTVSSKNLALNKSLSRAGVDRNRYSITVAVECSGYSDSQTKLENNSGKVDFVFAGVPVGANVTATCQISLGGVILYKASNSKVVEPEGTVLELELENILDNTFVIDSEITTEELAKLISHYNKDTNPTLVFNKTLGDLSEANPYLAATTRTCNVNFANTGKIGFSGTDYNLFNVTNLGNVILANNSYAEVNLTMNGSSVVCNDGSLDSAFRLLNSQSGVYIKFMGANSGSIYNSLLDGFAENMRHGFTGKIEIPNNSSFNFNVTQSNSEAFAFIMNHLRSTIELGTVTINEYQAYSTAVNAIADNAMLSKVNTLMLSTSGGLSEFTIPKIKDSVSNIGGIIIQNGNTSLTIDYDAFKGWTTNITNIPSCVKDIRCHSLEYINGTVTFADNSAKWYPVNGNNYKTQDTPVTGDVVLGDMDYSYMVNPLG